MNKENKVNKKLVKEYKVNVSYLEFISKLSNSKMELSKDNKESIESIYNEIVSLKFSNMSRVSYRNRRKEVIEKRNNYMSNELKLSEKEYNRVDKKVMEISKERRMSKYL